MTKEQLFLEIDEIYSEWHGGDLHIGKERTKRIKQVLDKAINYSQCCETLKYNEITFHEFTREFCVRIDNHLWLYKGIKYNDLELDLVYKQYINDLNL